VLEKEAGMRRGGECNKNESPCQKVGKEKEDAVTEIING